MTFNLTRDIVFFDIESTGLNVIRDRIVQIALIKYYKDGREPEEAEMLINPGIPISKESMEIHGITPDMVAKKPTFRQIAERLYNWIGDSDLGGYNSNRFDIPMLMEEFGRNGFDLDISKRRLIDVQRIFYKMEPRTLAAAYRKFCGGKEMEGAHDALVDVRATVDVLKGQLEQYKDVDFIDGDGFVTKAPIKNDIQALHDFSNDLNIIDVTQRLKLNSEGQIVFNFGKYINQEVGPLVARDRNYYKWIMEKDFTFQVKKIVKNELETFVKNNPKKK